MPLDAAPAVPSRADAHPATPPTRPPTLRRLAWGVAVATVLLAVFAAYLDPSMAVQLAQQLWSCF